MPGGNPNGTAGTATPGSAGTAGLSGVGVGGGIATIGTATIDNTSITGNTRHHQRQRRARDLLAVTANLGAAGASALPGPPSIRGRGLRRRA